MAALDEGGGNQGQTAADRIDWNDIEALALIGGKLPKECSQQVGQRRRSVNALIPSAKRLRGRTLHDCGTHNRNWEPCAMGSEKRFGNSLGERVSIRPS